MMPPARFLLAAASVSGLLAGGAALAQQAQQSLMAGHPFTGGNPVTQVTPAPPMPRDVTEAGRQTRSYPEQPPVIPHSIRDYQVDLNTNKCLTCHSREYTRATQAPMISITHYVDRDGQMLAGVAPRRYFCTGCHVPQTTAQPPVVNTFTEVDTLSTLRNRQGGNQQGGNRQGGHRQ